MSEIKHHFTGGKMNKDLDERLVPNGEYRDAMNIEVSTSEGSEVGTVQNILGNIEGCTWPNPPYDGGDPILPGSKTVGSISDEKNDTLYWLICGPNFDTSFVQQQIQDLQTQYGNTYDPVVHFPPLYAKDMIMRKNVDGGSCEPVLVDLYGVVVANIDANTNANVDSFLIPAINLPHVHVGMNVQTIDTNGSISEPTQVQSIGAINSITSSVAQNWSTTTTVLQSFNGNSFQVLMPTIPAFQGLNLTGNSPSYHHCILIQDCTINIPPMGLNTSNVQQHLQSGCQSTSVWDTQIASQGFVTNVNSEWSVNDGSGVNMLPPGASLVSQELVLMSMATGLAYRKACFQVNGVPALMTGTTAPTPVVDNTSFPDYHTLYNPNGVLASTLVTPVSGFLFAGPIVPPTFSFDVTQYVSTSAMNNIITLPPNSPWLDDLYQSLFDAGNDGIYGGPNPDDTLTPGAQQIAIIPNSTFPDLGNGNGGCIDPTATYFDPSTNALYPDPQNVNQIHIVDCTTGTPVLMVSGPNDTTIGLTVEFNMPAFTISSNTVYVTQPLPSIDRLQQPYLYFSSDRVLKFNQNNMITGLNIIDDLLFWTDGESEPKKINITRSVAGTSPNGLQHTNLINNAANINPTTGSIVPVKETHVTVVRKPPKKQLSFTVNDTNRSVSHFNSAIIDTVPTVGATSVSSVSTHNLVNADIGDEIWLIIPTALGDNGTQHQTFTLSWRAGDVILLNPSFANGTLPGTPLLIEDFYLKAEVLSYSLNLTSNPSDPGSLTSLNLPINYLNWVTMGAIGSIAGTPGSQAILDSTATVKIRIIGKNNISPTPGAGFPDPHQWVVDLLSEEEKLYEFKFPRFGYRYKYVDGEYSSFSHFTEVAFSPGPFRYHSKYGYNLAMRNNASNIILSGFSPWLSSMAGAPFQREYEDVESVDILYKEEGSPSVYVVDTIRPDDELQVDQNFNAWYSDSYKITSENIRAILPENQLLRTYDNVPLKAKAQEVTGNRIVYGNYWQNFNLTTSSNAEYYPDFDINVGVHGADPGTTQAITSIKTLRDYQLGVSFLDEFGRETPVISSSNATFSLEKSRSGSYNRLQVGFKDIAGAPLNMKYYKFYIKETDGEYYNMAMDRWYNAEDGGIWLSFPSSDRNKVDIDSFIILKKAMETNDIVTDSARYKVLAIENEAPDFIKTKKIQISQKLHDVGSSNPLAFDIFQNTERPLLNEIEFKLLYSNSTTSEEVYSNSSISKLDEEETSRGTLYFELENPTTNVTSARYRIASLSKTTWDGSATPTSIYFNVKLKEKLGIDINIFTDDPSGVNQTKIIDNTLVNLYEYKVENSAEFDGRFFVKIHQDSTFNRHILGNSPSSDDELFVVTHRNLYLLPDQNTSNQHRYAFRMYDFGANTNDWQNSKNLLPTRAVVDFTWNDDKSWVDYIKVTNATGQFLDNVSPWQGFAGAKWIPYQAFFRCMNVYDYDGTSNPTEGFQNGVGDHGIDWRLPAPQNYNFWGHWELLAPNLQPPLGTAGVGYVGWTNESDLNPTFADVWFIDEDPYISSFAYNSGNGKWTNKPSGAGGTGTGIQISQTGATIDLGFGGIQPVDAWPGLNSACGGSVNDVCEDDSFFRIADANSVYAAEQEEFVNRIVPGQKLRFKEDPNQEVYKIINVDHEYRVRYSSDPYKDGTLNHRKSAKGLNSTHNAVTSSLTGAGGAGGVIYSTSTYFRPSNFTRNFIITLDKNLSWNPVGNGIGTPINGGTSVTVNTAATGTVSSDGTTIALACNDKVKVGMVLDDVNGTQVVDQFGVFHPMIVTNVFNYTSGGACTKTVANLNTYYADRHVEGDSGGTISSAGNNVPVTFRQYTMNGLSNNSVKAINAFSGYNYSHPNTSPSASGGTSIGVEALGYNIEFLDGVEGGEPLMSEFPAIWETEPKETTDLDIYYEISDYNPLMLDGESVKTFIPRRSIIYNPASQDTLNPGIPVNTRVINHSITGEVALNQNVCYDNGVIPVPTGCTDPVILNENLNVRRPDGTEVIVQVVGFSDPQNNGTANALQLRSTLYDTTYYLNWHNCYSFGNGVESNRIRDGFNLPYILNGVKASTTLSEQYKEENRKYGLIYSGLYNSISGINNLNQFIMAEKITKDINPIYGSIQKLHSRNTDLVTLCEDKVLKILANKDAVYNADGNPQLTATENVLGQTIPFIGEYGISKNPESFASEAYRAYFTDKVRGTVMRLSKDGLTAISEHGMKDWFRDNLKLSYQLIGSYDDRKDEYNLTVKQNDTTVQTSNNTTITANNTTTISFKENVKGWVSFKSFVYENANSAANEYFTFLDGHLWKHHHEGPALNPHPRNTFYNNPPVPSSFNVILNDLPGSIKSFNTLNYEGSQSKIQLLIDKDPMDKITGLPTGLLYSDNEYYNLTPKDGWYVHSIETDQEKGSLEEFIEKEGKWFNYIRGRNIGVTQDGRLTNDYSDFDVNSLAVQGIGRASNITTSAVAQCTDPTFFNGSTSNTYDCNGQPAGTFGSGWNSSPCCIPVIGGCLDPNADLGSYIQPINDPMVDANTDDGSCKYEGCLNDPTAVNYGGPGNQNNIFPIITHDDGSCVSAIPGCTNPTAFNYDISANIDDGSCYPVIPGCMDSWTGSNLTTYSGAITVVNYVQPTGNLQQDVNTEDGSCIYAGCLNNPSASNYINTTPLSTATSTTAATCDDTMPYPHTVNPNGLPPCIMQDDQSCAGIGGCTDATACQGIYPLGATVNDGSCYYKACSDIDVSVVNYGMFEDFTGNITMNGANIVNLGTPLVGTGNTCGCKYCETPTITSHNSVYDPNTGAYTVTISWDTPALPWDASMLQDFEIWWWDPSCGGSSSCSNPYDQSSGMQSSTVLNVTNPLNSVTYSNQGAEIVVIPASPSPNPSINVQVRSRCNGVNSTPGLTVITSDTDSQLIPLGAPTVAGCTCDGGIGNGAAPANDCYNDQTPAANYNINANVDDGSCVQAMPGCTCGGDQVNGQLNGMVPPTYNDCHGNGYPAPNFDPTANVDDGSCSPPSPGCSDPMALNFMPWTVGQPNATTFNNTFCKYSCQPITGLFAQNITPTYAEFFWTQASSQSFGTWPNIFNPAATQAIDIKLERWDPNWGNNGAWVSYISNFAGYPPSTTASVQHLSNVPGTGGTNLFYQYSGSVTGISSFDGYDGVDMNGGDGTQTAIRIKPCPKPGMNYQGSMFSCDNTIDDDPTNNCGCHDYNSLNNGKQYTSGEPSQAHGGSFFPGMLAPNTQYKFTYQNHCTTTNSALEQSVTFTTPHLDGCTNQLASNYNKFATQDDGSCAFNGCTNPAAMNYGCSIDDPNWDPNGNTPCTSNIATVSTGQCANDGCCNMAAMQFGCLHQDAFNNDCATANALSAVAPCTDGVTQPISGSTSLCKTLGTPLAVDNFPNYDPSTNLGGIVNLWASNSPLNSSGYFVGYKTAFFLMDLSTTYGWRIWDNSGNVVPGGVDRIKNNALQTTPIKGSIEGGFSIDPGTSGYTPVYSYGNSYWPANQSLQVTDFTAMSTGGSGNVYWALGNGNRFLAINFGRSSTTRPMPGNLVDIQFKKKIKSHDLSNEAESTVNFTQVTVPACSEDPITVVPGPQLTGSNPQFSGAMGTQTITQQSTYQGPGLNNELYFQYQGQYHPGINWDMTDPNVGNNHFFVCYTWINGGAPICTAPQPPGWDGNNPAVNTYKLTLPQNRVVTVWYGMRCNVMDQGDRVFNPTTSLNHVEVDSHWYANINNANVATGGQWSSWFEGGVLNGGNPSIQYDTGSGTIIP